MFGHQDEPKDPVTDSVPSNDDNQDANHSDSPGIFTPAPTQDAASDGDDTSQSIATPAPSVTLPTPAVDDSHATLSPDVLLDLKQQALQQLTPLVGHLEQNPEEKFRTTMMMIQASDNQELIKTAYEAAQSITDEKARAQALLDIVNEINYFTQHGAK